jgi:hypothetical protein
LSAITVTALYQRDNVIRRDKFSQLQIDLIDTLDKENRDLLVKIVDLKKDIRGYKALNEAQEGRIQKMAGVFRIRELQLLEQIDRLKKALQGCFPNQEPIEILPAPPVPGCN